MEPGLTSMTFGHSQKGRQDTFAEKLLDNKDTLITTHKYPLQVGMPCASKLGLWPESSFNTKELGVVSIICSLTH
jgi:hypothetical protein